MGGQTSFESPPPYFSQGVSPFIKAITPNSSISDKVEKASYKQSVRFFIDHSKNTNDVQMERSGNSQDGHTFLNTHAYEQAWWRGFRKCVAKTPENFHFNQFSESETSLQCASSDNSWSYHARVPTDKFSMYLSPQTLIRID